jgi:transaldolase
MKIYLDTGNIEEIKKASDLGIIDGVTTNPTLIAKEGKKFEDVVKEICGILQKKSDDFTVSAEVMSTTATEMLKEGIPLSKIDKHVIIKVPLTPEGLKAVQLFNKQKIRTNVTLCFSAQQALLAAKAGAYIISPFVGRLDDIGQQGTDLLYDIRELYDNYGFKTQILAASIRNPVHVFDAAMAKADIATLPFTILMQLYNHPLTDAGIKKFTDDWNNYNGKQKQ